MTRYKIVIQYDGTNFSGFQSQKNQSGIQDKIESSIFALNNNMDVINLTLPFVLAASCAFMMPIATPPNAIVYSSNKFKISFMASNGFFINLISVTIISLYVYFFNNF